MDVPPPPPQIADMRGIAVPRPQAELSVVANSMGPSHPRLSTVQLHRAAGSGRACNPFREYWHRARRRSASSPLTVHVLMVAILLSTGGDARAESNAPGDTHHLTSLAPEGLQWMPDAGPECIARGRYKGFCQGPRRVPSPHGQAAALARELGLGTAKAAHTLLHKRVPKAWRLAAPRGKSRWLRWPIPEGRLVRGTGRVRRGRSRHKPHNGFDIAAPTGTPIRAVQSGLVAYSDNGVRGFGNLLILVHRDGSTTFYAHCQATLVFPGQQVMRGQVVALLGATGIARGPHLHFEYRRSGRALNPRRHFANLPKQARIKLREERKQLASQRQERRKR